MPAIESSSLLSNNPISRRVRSFIFGLKLPFYSVTLIIRNPALLFWCALPLVVTIGLYIYGIGALQSWTRESLQSLLMGWGWNPEGWLAWIVSILTSIFLWIASALTFSFVSGIIASPLNDLLAERVERVAEPPLSPVPHHLRGFQFRLIAIDLGKTLLASAAGIMAILLSWIPLVNLVAFVVSFLLICFQYISYPQTRRGLGVLEGAGFLWRHFYACAGFGLTISFLFAIPLVSCVALPIAVTGGTLLVSRAGAERGYLPKLY